MRIVDPQKTAKKDLHHYLLSAVAPRPIAFASTVDENGNSNLAPYSFFNAFSSNPPLLAFSSNTRSNKTDKDTLYNIRKTKEVVINVVSHSIVRQMAVASISFPTAESEFDKSGLTPIASDLVKPFRVKESPVQLECKVSEIIPIGSGHMMICEVVRMHIDENVLDDNDKIDPHKIDLMGRMGGTHYVRASGDALHSIIQSVGQISIGFDSLPKSVQNSRILTGNDIGQLAGMHQLPTEAEIEKFASKSVVEDLLEDNNSDELLHIAAKEALAGGKLEEALLWALVGEGV